LVNESFVSDCRQFPDIYISQGSVSIPLRCDGSLMIRITAKSEGEKIVKIGQHLPKLWAFKYRVVFYETRCT